MSPNAANSSLPVPADQFAAFCSGIERLCGIDLASYKRRQMERRVRSFAQSRGKDVLLDYLALLAADPLELDQFLDRMTINVSQLWRNPDQWETLAEYAVPELARAGRIRAWSAGCSYGAEVYTLAAVCLEAAPTTALEVRGSDIDERMIARARQGNFSEADMRSVPDASRDRWFEPTADGWRGRDELKELASFEVEDLLACSPEPESYDLISCRNIVIYFKEDSRAALHAKLAGALRSGGYLMVGASERVVAAETYGLELVFPFTYLKG